MSQRFKILASAVMGILMVVATLAFADVITTSHKADDVFTKLISNTAGLTKGEAVFEFYNPLSTKDIEANLLDFDFIIPYDSTGINRVEKYVLVEDVPYTVPVYETVSEPCDYIDPKTKKSVSSTCTRQVQKGTRIEYRDEWYDVEGFKFEPRTTYRIKLVAYWTPKIGGNSKEWIPKIEVEGTELKQTKWAWWHNNWQNCIDVNWTESNGTARVNEPVLITANLTGKRADSRDVRYVNAECNNDGTEVDYELVYNDTDVVTIALFVNATASGTTRGSIYYNNSASGSVYSKDIFLYINNGTMTWDSGGGDKPVAITNDYLDWQSGASNAGNYTLLPSDFSTGNWWFSYRVDITAEDANGVSFSVGDDYSGASAYQGWVMWLMSYGSGAGRDYQCYDGGAGHDVIANHNLNQYYLIEANWSMADLTTTAGAQVRGDKGSWVHCGKFEGGVSVDSMYEMRFHGGVGHTQVKDVWLSNQSFNTYITPIPYVLGGVQNKPSSAPTVNLDYPADNTKFDTRDITLSCNATSGSDLVNVSLFGNFTGSWIINQTTDLPGGSDTSYQAEFNVTVTQGSFVWNCQAYDDLSQDAFDPSNRTIEVDFWAFDRIDVDATPYETTKSNITLVINISDATGVSDVNATLTWNNTVFTPVETSATGNYSFRYEVTVPLVQVNNTNITYYWNYTIVYTEGSSAVNTTSWYNQTVLFAYDLSSLSSDASGYLSGQTIQALADIGNMVQTAGISVNGSFNGSFSVFNFSSRTGNIDRYIANFTAPSISGSEQRFNISATLNITFENVTRIENGVHEVLVSQLSITNCSAGSASQTPVLNFTMFDEESRDQIKGEMEIRVSSESFNYSFAVTNVSSYQLCLFPNTTTIPVNVTVEYQNATTHSKREYYLTNILLNVSTVIYSDMYLLELGLSDPVKIIVKDEAEQPETGVVMKIQRFYASTNSYITVSMVKTDDNGEDITNLRTNTIFYKFIAERDGLVLTEYAPSKIPFDSVISDYATLTFKIVSTSLGDIFNYYGMIASSCTYNNATTVVRCTATDTSGAVGTFNFLVQQEQSLSWSDICTDTATTSAVTFTCTLGATANSTYRYSLTAETDSSEVVLEAGYLNFKSLPIFGDVGLLLAFIMFLSLSAVGVWNPNVSLTLGSLSLIVSFALGLFTVGIGALIGLLVAIGIIIKKNG